MTLSKLGKRVSAFLCAAFLILNLALYPLRARATAGALAAVAGVTVLSAYLMASGVYPYISEAGQNLSQWTSDNLQPLIDKYNDYLVSIGKSYQIVLNGATPTIKGYMTQGAIMIANDVWGKLQEFVQWVQSEYALADNQQGVQLGVTTTALVTLPVLREPTPALMISSGLLLGLNRGWNSSNPPKYYGAADGAGAYVGVFPYGSQTVMMFAGIQSDMQATKQSYYYNGGAGSNNITATRSYKGQIIRYLYAYYDYPYGFIDFDDNLPRYASESEFLDMLVSGVTDTFSGILADTTAVAPPDALPADTPWGGLAVEGTSNPVGVVEQGITNREKPVVRPVEVEIQQGTDVDSETGEVTENPVVVSPEDVVPTVAALSPPASFLSALQTTMTTKFPFCLPFDLFKVLQAFYVAPEAPVFFLSFHDPFSNSDFSIRVDLSPWDEVAAVVRNFEAMILLAGFCLNFDKFNVIHLILGGLG